MTSRNKDTKILRGISLVINTKNEEDNIVDCIRSAKNAVNEIIVIDMQSTDETANLAKKEGARVFSIRDFDIVDPARRFAVSKANYEWVLLLDADERIPAKLLKKLKKISLEGKWDVVKIPYKNMIFGKWIEHTWWWPDYHERFFRKGYVYWPSGVHEAAKAKGRILTLPAVEENAVVHYNYKNIKQFVEKMNRYTDHEEGPTLKGEGMNPAAFVGFYEGEFMNRYIYQKGYMDGLHGFFLSKLMEFYRFLALAKYWEKNDYTDLVEPKELHEFIDDQVVSRYQVTRINELVSENQALRRTLDEITNSKTFQFWQGYCKVRDSFLGRKKK